MFLSAHFAVWVTVWVSNLTHILTHTILAQKITKTTVFIRKRWFFGAAGQIRTADLILTKDALYLLSYSSKGAPRMGNYK